MTQHSDLLSRVRVASPCPANWDEMTGDERVRFCQLCDLPVYNLTRLTTNELRELLSREGRVCGRLYRRSDDTVITRDCPVGLKALRRRIVKTASAVFGMLLGLSSLTYGQSTSTDESKSQNPNLEIRQATPQGDQLPGLTGVIVDMNGAVIVGATIILRNKENKESSVATDSSGHFRFNVVDGRYALEVSAMGFQKFVLTNLDLDQKLLTYARIRLTIGALMGEVVLELKPIEPSYLNPPTQILPKTLKRN